MKSRISLLPRIGTIVVMLLVPVVLALLSVRIVLNPWYINFEYHTPGFPPDSYGFSMAERLRYLRMELNFLTNNAGISYLGDLHFPAGQVAPPVSCMEMTDCTLLYNQRELQHMVDAKNVVQAALRVLWASLAILILFGVWSWQAGWLDSYLVGLRRGGWLTIGLMGAVLILVVVAFGSTFLTFHEIFFPPGSFTFYESDTLIRLTPERFWRDTFIMVGVITGVMAVALALGASWVRRRLYFL